MSFFLEPLVSSELQRKGYVMFMIRKGGRSAHARAKMRKQAKRKR
jgi:hypothetical protein